MRRASLRETHCGVRIDKSRGAKPRRAVRRPHLGVYATPMQHKPSRADTFRDHGRCLSYQLPVLSPRRIAEERTMATLIKITRSRFRFLIACRIDGMKSRAPVSDAFRCALSPSARSTIMLKADCAEGP